MKPKLAHNPFSYRRNLPHIQKADKELFVTFHSYNYRILPSKARDIVLKACLFQDGKSMQLHAAVVMPRACASSLLSVPG